MVIPQSIDQPTTKRKVWKRELDARPSISAFPMESVSARSSNRAPSSKSTETSPCITVTLLDHARRATSEGHRLHFLQQLKFLLVPDGDDDNDGVHGFPGDRRDDDGGDTDSVHRTYRSRALDNSIDYQLMELVRIEVQQELHHQQQEEHMRRTPNVTTTATAVECLVSLWQHASQERRQSAFSHLVTYASCLIQALQLHPDHDPLFANAVQIFRIWTRSTKDQVLIGKLIQTPGLISCFRDCLLDESTSRSRHEIVSALLKELSFRARAHDNQQLCSNLSEALSKRLAHALDDHATPYRTMIEGILAVLWKFSTHPILSRSMADESLTWTILRRVASMDIGTESLVMHRHAASIVGCLMAMLCEGSSEVEDKVREPPTQLVQPRHIASEHCPWILSHVHRVFRAERDDDLRRRWMRLLRCWAASEWGRGFLFQRSEPSLNQNDASSEGRPVTLLVQVLRHPEESVDVRYQACQAIANLLPAVGQSDHGSEFDGIFGPCLESILTDVIRDDRTPGKLMVPLCDALNASILYNHTWKRGPSNCSTAFYERLVSALQEGSTDPVVHDRISKLVLNLVESNPTGPHQALHHIADLAAVLVTPVGPEYEQSRDNGVSIVESILRLPDASAHHRKVLADNEKLLSALVGYCLQHHIDLNQKDRAKRLIIELVPEL